MKKFLLAAITLLISGNVSIAQDKWQKIVSSTFGTDPSNKAITKMHVFKGQIYAGTGNNTGEIHRSSNGNSGTWMQTFAPPFVESIDDINSINEGGGFIYVSAYASGSDVPRISRSADGSTWLPYYEGSDRLPFVFPFKGTGTVDSIYIVRDSYPTSTILKAAFDSNDPLDTANTFDTLIVLPAFDNIKSYTFHNNRIYVGTNNTGKIWISSPDGNTWKQDTLFQPGFGNANNYAFTAMTSFGGYLYVGTENSTDGAQIWRSNNDTVWTNVATFPGTNKVTSLSFLSGQLWVTLEKTGSGRILKSADGLTYVYSDSTGFGVDGNDGMKGSTVLFGNHIYYGYENKYTEMPQVTQDPSRGLMGSGGGEIWRYCLGTLPMVELGPDTTVCAGIAVTFDAGPGHTAYEWSNETTAQTITVTDPDHYKVTVTAANGCQNWDEIRLINVPSPSVYTSMPEGLNPHTVCKGDTLEVFMDVNSNLRNPLTPIFKPTNVQISNPLGTTYDTITVSGINDWAADALYSVTIDSIRHIYVGDVTLTLQAPDGSMITLVANQGGGGQDFMGTVFKKTGSDITLAGPPFTGTYMPFNPFSNLTGSADGNWVLRMDDDFSTDDGILKGWTIRFSEKDTVMTFSWTPAAGLTSSTTANTKVIGNVSTTYVLTATNSIGCSSTDTLSTMVPKMQVGAATAVACYQDSVMLTATGGIDYTWYPVTSLNNTTSDTVFASPSVATTYYVTDTIDGVCPIIDSVMVSANPQIIVNAGLDTAICSGSAAILNGLTTGGTPAYSYQWQEGSTTYSVQNPTVTPTANTTYELSVTDAAGCKAVDSVTISLNPLPVADAGISLAICLGDTTTLNGTAGGGSSGYTYLWNDGSTTQSISVSPSGTTTFTLTVTDVAGCSDTDSAVVTINPLPTADAGTAQSICLNGTATLNGSASGGTPAYMYLWDNGSTAVTVMVSPVSDTVYVLTVTDALGCSDTDSAMVTINPLPVADAGVSKTICFSDKDTLNGSAAGGSAPYTYLWNNGGTTQNIIVGPGSTTTYTLTVTDNNGCTAMDNVTMNVTPSTNIYGHVNYSGGNLANGNVVLYKYLPYLTHFDTVLTYTLNASGDYQFLGVDYGEYLIEVFADTTLHPNAVPTYYGDEFLWDSSTVVVHGCTANDTADITLIEIPAPMGPGSLSGFIKEGQGFVRAEGDPIPDIDVKVGKNPGGLSGSTVTDDNGFYKFMNLPLGTYTIYADIPGLGRDSTYTIDITPTDLNHDSLNYLVDSTVIYIPDPNTPTGITKPIKVVTDIFNVYPNPSCGNVTIEYALVCTANVSLGIYNVLGVKVYEIVNDEQFSGRYKYDINTKKTNLNSGVYFVTLIINGKISIQKIVISD